MIMKQMNRILFVGTLVLVVFSACSPGKQSENNAADADAQVKKEVVKVMELQMQTVARSVEYPATLEPYDEVHLAPASPGRIEGIFTDVGDRVNKGDVLVQMDRTQLHQAEVQLKNLEVDYNRLDTLAKYGSVPRQQFDQLKTQYEVAKSNVAFLQENTRMLAPFSGVVSGRYFEPGEMYSGAPNTQAGKAAVLSIVKIDQLKTLVPLSEKYFPQVKRGMKTRIKVDIYPDRDFTGIIERIHPTINPANRTFNAEVKISNPEQLLRPGMFARVTLDLDEEEAILLPGMAVLKMQGSNDRYLFKEVDGKARRIAVIIGQRFDDQIEVFSDELKIGDKIVINGQARLMDGSPLKVIQ